MVEVRRLILLIALVLCSAVVYLIGNGTVALWDRDEPRYAETSREMLQHDDWVVPTFLDKPRTAKPPLIYWCQAACMKIFGVNEFAARFPSAIAIAILLILLSVVLWRPLGSELTLWTVFVFATSALTIAAAKMCITDAVLLLWVTLAQLCLYAMWRGNQSWPMVVTFSVLIGLAGLTKGPVILGMQVTTLIALGLIKLLNRRYPPALDLEPAPSVPGPGLTGSPASLAYWSESYRDKPPGLSWVQIASRISVGLMIVTAIVLPWVLMVNHRSKNFIQKGFGHEVVDRMMTPLEQHVGPPGYYFLTLWVTFFPWSLLLPMAIGLAIHRRADPRVRFALAAIVGPWVLLECVRTKLPHYFLPVFPPLAFLTADALLRSIRGQITDLSSRLFTIGVGIWAVLVAMAASTPWILFHRYSPLPISAMIALSGFGIVFAIAVLQAFKRRRFDTAGITMGLGTFAFVAIAYLWYLPNAEFLRLSPRLADILTTNGVTHPGQVLMLEYMEPSLAFAQGGSIREAGDLAFTKRFESQLTPWLVLPESVWDKAPADLRGDYVIVDHCGGLAYANKGKWMTVLVIHRRQH